MTHNISDESGRPEMAFAGHIPTPWWTTPNFQGRDLGENPVTSAEMLAASGMDWEVATLGMHTEARWGHHPELRVPNTVAVVRSDTNTVVATVSAQYEAVQNVDAFKFFDGIVGEGQAEYVSAGCLGRGQRVWILARLPETLTIAGNEVERYILLTNSHDGTSALRFQPSAVQVVCQNTFNIALAEHQPVYRQRHSKGVNTRLDARDAAQIIGLAGTYYENFAAEAEKLRLKPMSPSQIDKFLVRMFPFPALPAAAPVLTLPSPDPVRWLERIESRVHTRREAVKRHIKDGRGQADIRHTAWGAFSGLTEWIDHDWLREKTAASSIIGGEARRMKQQAWADLKDFR